MKVNKESKATHNTTTGLLDALLGTLDVDAFLRGIAEFDRVTQNQCLLKARKELLKARIARLHGDEKTRHALSAISAAIEAMEDGKVEKCAT